MMLINDIYNERFINKNIKEIRYVRLFTKRKTTLRLIEFYFLNRITYSFYKFNYNIFYDITERQRKINDIKLINKIIKKETNEDNIVNKNKLYIINYYDLVVIHGNNK